MTLAKAVQLTWAFDSGISAFTPIKERVEAVKSVLETPGFIEEIPVLASDIHDVEVPIAIDYLRLITAVEISEERPITTKAKSWPCLAVQYAGMWFCSTALRSLLKQ